MFERELAGAGERARQGAAVREQGRHAHLGVGGIRVGDEDEQVEVVARGAFGEEPCRGRCRDARASCPASNVRPRVRYSARSTTIGWPFWHSPRPLRHRLRRGRCRARERLEVHPDVGARRWRQRGPFQRRTARAQELHPHLGRGVVGVLQEVEEVESAVRRAFGQVPRQRRCLHRGLGMRAGRVDVVPRHRAVGHGSRRVGFDGRRELRGAHAAGGADVDRGAVLGQDEAACDDRAVGLLVAQQDVGGRVAGFTSVYRVSNIVPVAPSAK